MKYGSGKCVSSTFLASRGTDTSMNGLECWSEFQALATSADKKAEMSPVMLLLADLAQSYRL